MKNFYKRFAYGVYGVFRKLSELFSRQIPVSNAVIINWQKTKAQGFPSGLIRIPQL